MMSNTNIPNDFMGGEYIESLGVLFLLTMLKSMKLMAVKQIAEI